jgi:hypothetical protein
MLSEFVCFKDLLTLHLLVRSMQSIFLALLSPVRRPGYVVTYSARENQRMSDLMMI